MKLTMTMKRAASAIRKTLHMDDREYKLFTHGGNWWRDNYHLHYWDECIQPVVYRNHVYNGYKLLRRLGDWCWLTKDPKTQKYLTVKFLSQGQVNDLNIGIFLKQRCSSPFISIIEDHFTIPHHLAETHPKYRDVKFDAIVYETLGADLRRESSGGEVSRCKSPSLELRVRCIQQAVQAVAELHRMGVVHGDLHAGNLALPPPANEQIDQFLAEPPLEHDIIRKDGAPTPAHLPQRVTEPENIGHGHGDIKLFDFGYAFRHMDGAAYSKHVFARGTTPAPELLGGRTTTDPFKAESWYLGQMIYFILADGFRLLHADGTFSDKGIQREYNICMAHLKSGQNLSLNELPDNLRLYFLPLILALLDSDPHKRPSVEYLSKDENFLRIRA
ncbi:hypothetical protein J3458_013254 [Metarhizium acridum]|uniref:uncharacterized protein n=1 Tax=Metarhizium acridum TaxID=92637 RepID=UPI001C6B8D9C|nr:hypothetical protein J3458_013254 [Metarhizium acridum]